MRWITFCILLYLAAALQVSHLGGIPAKPGGAPGPNIEYLPLLAIFYGLYASEASAPLAAIFCGLLYDLLMGPVFIGTNMVPLALVVWVLVRIRMMIFREHVLSQVVMTLLGVAG